MVFCESPSLSLLYLLPMFCFRPTLCFSRLFSGIAPASIYARLVPWTLSKPFHGADSSRVRVLDPASNVVRARFNTSSVLPPHMRNIQCVISRCDVLKTGRRG